MAGFDINWGLAQPVNVGGAFQQGWQTGQAMRQETDTRNALVAYAQNPSMETANALLPHDPRIGMQMVGQQREMEQVAAQREARSAAARGDPGAMDALAGIDLDAWSKFDVRHREQVKQATGFMGQAVLDVSRLPEPERPAAWASYVQQAESNGLDIPQQYEQYSPQALNAAAAEAGQMEKLIKQFEPDYRAVPQGGYLENVNPLSRETPIPVGPPSGTPQPGTVEGGYRFRGGDPADPSAWEPAGGPTQPASATFP